MNKFSSRISELFYRINLRSNLPNSLDCLKSNTGLYKQLYLAESFNDSIKILEYALDQSKSTGVALEFGVYSGRTLKVIAKKYPDRTFGFDSFEGLPEFWRDGFAEGTFKLNEVPFVEHAFILKGLFQDSLEPFENILMDPISFIHLDADLYSSTKFVLSKLNDLIKPGCIILFDEFMNYPGFECHEYLAFNEWCKEFGRQCKPFVFSDWHEQMGFKVIL